VVATVAAASTISTPLGTVRLQVTELALNEVLDGLMYTRTGVDPTPVTLTSLVNQIVDPTEIDRAPKLAVCV
jgi:hypothetical protein